jgi:intracellular septation protein A
MSIFLSATLPLFIYFAIDHFFEFHIAIILTVIYGILEFTFFYIKDKRVDKLILIATILVVTMGVISYIFDNEAFFKLKPAIMQLLGVAFLMYFVITKKSIFDLMKDRLPKNAREIPPERQDMMNIMVRDMAIMLFLHTFLIIYSAY